MVPWTTARMLTCSRSQQQLMEAASHLPALDPYGYGHSVQLLHPRVTEEYRPVDIASSLSQPDDNASSSSLQPIVQAWTCRKCAQPSTGASHQNIHNVNQSVKISHYSVRPTLCYKQKLPVQRKPSSFCSN